VVVPNLFGQGARPGRADRLGLGSHLELASIHLIRDPPIDSGW
jgi:hypothetical protein